MSVPVEKAESAVIRLQSVSRSYRMGAETIHALHDVSLSIARNEYAAIVGQSGSGKSTLMNVLGCLDSPTAGDYWLNGQQVSAMNDRDPGARPQQPNRLRVPDVQPAGAAYGVG